MWWIKENTDPSRGGFQNRDVGRSNFDGDYGPEYGVDYARYSDPPDASSDYRLLEQVRSALLPLASDQRQKIEIKVRNGFVILKGEVDDSAIKDEAAALITHIPSVREVINQIHIV